MFSLASLPHGWSAFFCFIPNCADCDLAPGLSLSFSSDQNPAFSDLHMAHFLTSFIFIPQSNIQCSWSTLSRTIFSPCYYSASCDELSPEHTNTSRSIYSFVYYRLLSNPSQNYKTHRGKHFLFISAGSSVPKTILCNQYFTSLIKQVLLLYVFIRIFSWFPFIHFQQDAWKVFPFRAVHILRYFLLFVLFVAVEYSFCTLCK